MRTIREHGKEGEAENLGTSIGGGLSILLSISVSGSLN